MKRILLSILVASIAASIAYANTDNDNNKLAELESRIKILEKLVLDEKITESDEFKEKKAENKKESYFKKIQVSSVKASYMDSYLDGKVPGITFKLKNQGGKTLEKIEVTFYFMDKDDVVIYEEDFTPVSSNRSYKATKPLKPNYSWQMERGKFYSLKSLPDEWAEGKVKAEITDIEFSQ